MEYTEYEAPPGVQHHVQCAWRLYDPAPAMNESQTIYPDGRCEIIVHLGVPLAMLDAEHGWMPQQHAMFAGQLRTAIRLAARGPVDCIGIRLHPAASACIANRPPSKFRDRVIDLAEVDRALAARLKIAARKFGESTDRGELWEVLQSKLLSYAVDPRIESAIERLHADHGLTRIPALAAGAGMSLRSFQGRFLACVGLGAKEFARIVRLQATLRALDGGSASLAGVAVDAGFADQSHATRELRRFTGLTPARLFAALNNERETDSTVRLAAAFVRGRAS